MTDTIIPQDRDTVKGLKTEDMPRFLAEFDYKQGYRDSVDFLDKNFAFFLTHVLNMGKPELDSAVPTACVALPSKTAKREDFKYIFNPTLFALLDTEERAFVMGHETMHVLLNHLILLRKGEQSGKYSDMRKFNIAADCVINDYLMSMGLLPGRLGSYGCFGPQVVGFDCSNATVAEVYAAIPDQKDEDGEGEGEGEGGEGEPQEGEGQGEGEGTGEGQPGGSGGQGSGDPLDDFLKGAGAGNPGQSGQGFDDHDWLKEDDAQAQKEAEKAADKIGEETDKKEPLPESLTDKKEDGEGGSKTGSPGIGSGDDARMRKWQEQKGVSLKWAELLKEIDPEMFKIGGPPPRPSYHNPRRKLVGINHDRKVAGQRPIILPVMRKDPRRKDGQIPSIFMALDTSGSCAHYADKFITLAKSVPQDKIKLWCVTFTTTIRELDLEDPKWSSGGTSFGPIETYIRTKVVDELGHYPSAVVVISDGAGYFSGTAPAEENKNAWYWLLTDNKRYATSDALHTGREVAYEKFIEGTKGGNKGL